MISKAAGSGKNSTSQHSKLILERVDCVCFRFKVVSIKTVEFIRLFLARNSPVTADLYMYVMKSCLSAVC